LWFAKAGTMSGSARRTTMTLSFHGAAGTVTGSRFMVRTPETRVLVDAGLFQGLRQLRRRNWDPVPFAASDLDAVVVSHAHLDHSGYLPVLSRDGLAAPVVATTDTLALTEIVLQDSAKLQEEDAHYAASRGFSKHSQPKPLYGRQDVAGLLASFAPLDFDEERLLGQDLAVRLRPAGHILGSSTVILESPVGSVLFSGDLGRPHHPLLRPPALPPSVDTLVIESTYGDRRHPVSGSEQVADVVRRTVGRGGSVVIPAFAVDRTEVLLVSLGQLLAQGQIPPVPVYLDSPMALKALEVYRLALMTGRRDLRDGVERLIDIPGLQEVRTTEESIALNSPRSPCIILSASGMATGGRVVHHLKHMLPNERNSVLLVGYQAVGTRGRDLAEGASSLKMHGRYVPVRAEVSQVDGFSVHADADELVAWASAMPEPPATTYVVHGEREASETLARRFRRELGWNAVVPRDGETVRIDRASS
jgi:metallo-beta-lactamase family protein